MVVFEKRHEMSDDGVFLVATLVLCSGMGWNATLCIVTMATFIYNCEGILYS